MYQYPYGNAQQLNLDWILNKIQEIEAQNVSPADIKVFVNAVLSASYDSSSAYDVNDIVFNDSLSKLYRCNTAIPAGGEAWDATHWDEILLAPVVSNLVEAVSTMSSDDVFNESTVTGIHVTDALDALSNAISTAAQTAVTNVRYNNHKLQQQVNGSYSDIIQVEDTPSNNSDRLASSKAAYEISEIAHNNQLNFAPVETTLIASQSYAANDFVIVSGRLRRVIAAITAGDTFVSGTNIAATSMENEMTMIEYQGTIDASFAAMGADSFYLRCYTYFHTFGITWLSFYCPVVTPNTTITIGNFPSGCSPAGSYSITWTGQKGGTYMITFNSSGVVTLYCTDSTPEAQFVRCYVPLLINS